MDSSSSRHGSHKQYGVKSEECEVQSLMRNHRGQFNDLFNTQQKIEQAFLGLRKELDLYRQKVQQLEAEKAEYQLEQLRPVTIFDVTDEFISHELNTFHRSLDSWAHALPEIQNPSFRARVLPSDSISPHQHLSQRGGPNSGLALSYEDQKHLEPELVAAALSRIMLDMMFSQRLFGIPQNDRRIFTNLLNTIPRMKAGEDSKSIETSQKDIVRVWSQSSSYRNDRDDACDKIIETIKCRLTGWGYPVRDMRDSFRHLEVQSVQPAAKLATKMQCSYEKYDWAISESFPSSVQKKWLAEFDVVDFKTHCEIPPSNLSGLPDNAFIGQYVMMIFPPLYRKNTDDNEPYVLVAKGRCVVKHPHKNRSRRHSSRRWPSVISK